MTDLIYTHISARVPGSQHHFLSNAFGLRLTERWCNQVAAEVLMPSSSLRASYQRNTPIREEIQRLAHEFKVSTLVALRRLFDAGYIDRDALWQHYRAEQERLRTLEGRTSPGGDFYRSLGARTSKRFARAIVSSTLEGLT